jgi:hypothetical protein
MIKVNNAKLDWRAYEFGVRYVNDEGKSIVVQCGTRERAITVAKFHRDEGGKVKFRAVYVTEWMDEL